MRGPGCLKHSAYRSCKPYERPPLISQAANATEIYSRSASTHECLFAAQRDFQLIRLKDKAAFAQVVRYPDRHRDAHLCVRIPELIVPSLRNNEINLGRLHEFDLALGAVDLAAQIARGRGARARAFDGAPPAGFDAMQDVADSEYPAASRPHCLINVRPVLSPIDLNWAPGQECDFRQPFACEQARIALDFTLAAGVGDSDRANSAAGRRDRANPRAPR